MKNILTAFLLLFTTFTTFSQKIEVIDHGNDYRKIKELSYYDFKDKCNDGNGWILCGGKVFPYMLEDESGYNFLCSQFASFLMKKDRGLAKNYTYDLSKIAGNNSFESVKYFHHDFANGTKRAYNYLQLQIERFEIVSEYYKDIYNYQISKVMEEEELEMELNKVKDSILGLPLSDSSYFNTLENLKFLKEQKEINRIEFTTLIENKIQDIESLKKQKIKDLPIDNYSANKSKIINEFDPQISALREELKVKLIENENYWNDKIDEKEKELIVVKNNNSSIVENLIVKEQERKRNEFKSKSILAVLREQIEEKYLKDLAAVVAKIEELKNNK